MFLKKLAQRLLKPHFTYLLIFIIFVNYGIYTFFKNFIYDQDNTLLESYRSSLEKVIEYDISLIDSSDTAGTRRKQIFILQDIGTKNLIKNLGGLDLIENSKFLYHERMNADSIFVDIQKLKEIIDEILPPTLMYQVSLDSNIINTPNISLVSKANHEIGNKLKISLYLNENSIIIKGTRYLLRRLIILVVTVSLIFIVAITASFYKIRQKFNKLILKQKKLLAIANEKIKAIQEGRIAKKKIDNFFVKKATEIYTKEELKGVQNNKELKHKILENIGSKNYIFPIVLKGISKSTIETNGFFENLEKSLASYMFKSKISFNVATQYLSIFCDKEVLYQIIFSLTTNIMMFLENQSDEIKDIDTKVLEDRIIFVYKGYPLSRANMIKLTNHMLPMCEDTFLLTGTKLFESIDYHSLEYKFVNSGFKNKIELLFYKEIEETRITQTKILQFEEAKNRKNKG